MHIDRVLDLVGSAPFVRQRVQIAFSGDSKYRALEYRNGQYEAILKYTEDYAIPVHYLLYNPVNIPFNAELPASTDNEAIPETKVGCRVIKAETLDGKLNHLKQAQHPSFKDVAGSPMASDFWTLHNFVADMVMGCKEGYVGGSTPINDPGLFASSAFGEDRYPPQSR